MPADQLTDETRAFRSTQLLGGTVVITACHWTSFEYNHVPVHVGCSLDLRCAAF